MTKRHWLSVVTATGVLLIVVFPCLWPQLLFAAQTSYPSTGNGILHRLPALLAPNPLVSALHPNEWGAYSRWPWTALFFVGYMHILAAISLLAVRVAAHFHRGESLNFSHACLLFLLCATFGFSLGNDAIFWRAFTWMPIAKKFAQPWKFLGFLAFLVPLLGAIAMEEWLKRSRRPRILEGAFLTLTVLSLIVHIPSARATYDYFQDDIFPELPKQLRPFLDSSARLKNFPPSQPTDRYYYNTLPHNLPTRYRLPAVDGYDRLVEIHPESRIDPLRLQDYGVRWVLTPSTSTTHTGGHKITTFDGTNLFELPGPAPLISANEKRLDSYRLLGNGIRIDVPKGTNSVTINYLWRKGMRAKIDGRWLDVQHDNLNRMHITPQPDTRTIEIFYYPVFRWGHWLVGFIGILMYWLTRTMLLRSSS
jgi:hypothetical protein